MNAKHTPGPWSVDSESVHAAVDVYSARWGSSDVVCAVPTEYRTGGLITNMDRANLRLISAAPELLQALEGLLVMVEAVLTDSQLDHDHCGRTIRNAIRPTRAAIAKAKGEA